MTDKTELLRLADALESAFTTGRFIDYTCTEAPAILRKLAEQPNPWRDVIDNELVCSHLGTWESFPDATTALNAVLNWHIDVSLSPEVSSDAEALVQRGRDEKEAEIARLREDAERYRWLRDMAGGANVGVYIDAKCAHKRKWLSLSEMDSAIDAASKP